MEFLTILQTIRASGSASKFVPQLTQASITSAKSVSLPALSAKGKSIRVSHASTIFSSPKASASDLKIAQIKHTLTLQQEYVNPAFLHVSFAKIVLFAKLVKPI